MPVDHTVSVGLITHCEKGRACALRFQVICRGTSMTAAQQISTWVGTRGSKSWLLRDGLRGCCATAGQDFRCDLISWFRCTGVQPPATRSELFTKFGPLLKSPWRQSFEGRPPRGIRRLREPGYNSLLVAGGVYSPYSKLRSHKLRPAHQGPQNGVTLISSKGCTSLVRCLFVLGIEDQ
jgi:hypothetical protein